MPLHAANGYYPTLMILLRSLLFWILLWAGGWLISGWLLHGYNESFAIIVVITIILLVPPLAAWLLFWSFESRREHGSSVLRLLLFWISIWLLGWVIYAFLTGRLEPHSGSRALLKAAMYLFVTPTLAWGFALLLTQRRARYWRKNPDAERCDFRR